MAANERLTSGLPASADTLPVGERLGHHEIRGVVSADSVGNVYRAWDHGAQREVLVREYLPAGLATRVAGSADVAVMSAAFAHAFDAGLAAFIGEARLLSRIGCPSLFAEHEHWQAHETAYRAMPLPAGPTLRAALVELGRVPSEGELRIWLRPLLDALRALHEHGVLHQDVSPDSIVLAPRGAVLVGPDAARHVLAGFGHTTFTALAPGYTAIEQYGSVTDTRRGPWTDLYALAAVVHAAITGAPPPLAADRLADDRLLPLTRLAAGLYADRFLAGIDAALAVAPERRPQDTELFRGAIGEIDTPWHISSPGALQADPMLEPFLEAVPAGVDDNRSPVHRAPAASAPRPVTAATQTVREAVGPTAAVALASAAPAPATPSPASPAPAIGTAAPSRPAVPRAPGSSTSRPSAPIPLATPVAVTRPGDTLRTSPTPNRSWPVATIVGVGLVVAGGWWAAQQMSSRSEPIVSTATDRPAPIAAALPSTSPRAPVPASGAGRTTRADAAVAATTPTSPSALSPAATKAAAVGTVDTEARCIEVLQKASLEAISGSETEFYKSHCK